MKKKKKHKKKKKREVKIYKLAVLVGGVFHLVVYLLIDLTFYNNTLFWVSLILCGLISGMYIINHMQLLNPKSYKKINGVKLKIFMFIICLLVTLGTTGIIGNVVNGFILGVNYIGKSSETIAQEYKVDKIIQSRTGGRKRMRRNNPKVTFIKDGKITIRTLTEYYNKKKNYSEYKTVAFVTSRGLLGFDIVESYELKK